MVDVSNVVNALTNKFEQLKNKSNVISDIAATGDDVKYTTITAVRTWVNTKLLGKQDVLIGSGAGQNIKTINNQNIMGSGNISISVEGEYLQEGDNISKLVNDEGYLTEHQSLENYPTTSEMNTAINNYHDNTKVDKVTGKGLSTNDYTTDEKNKLADLENYDDTSIQSDISSIKGKIPSEATSSNQLADKNFVNSSIATGTATFRGTFNSVSALEEYSGEKDNNDYAFVKIMDTSEPTQVKQYDKYKYNGSSWVFEYTLNNSSFTSIQWAAINSGLNSTSLNNYHTKTEILNLLNDKVDKVTGKGLSTNDYTTDEKNKLADLENYDDTTLAGRVSTLESSKITATDAQNYFDDLAEAIDEL